MFNDALLTMDTKYAAYRLNNIGFKDYLEYLVSHFIHHLHYQNFSY